MADLAVVIGEAMAKKKAGAKSEKMDASEEAPKEKSSGVAKDYAALAWEAIQEDDQDAFVSALTDLAGCNSASKEEE